MIKLLLLIGFILFIYPFVSGFIGGPILGKYAVRGNKPDPDWPGYQDWSEYGCRRPPKREKPVTNYDSPYCPFPKEIAERPIINPEDTEVREEEDVPLDFKKPTDKSPREKAKEWMIEKADLITELTKPVGEPGRICRIKAKELEGIDDVTKDEIVSLILTSYARTVSQAGIDPESQDILIKMA